MFYDEAADADSLQGLSTTSVRKKYGKAIRSAASEMLATVGASKPEQVDALVKVVLAALKSSRPSDLSTGIIVAGYHSDDMFPSVAMADIDGSLCGLVKSSHRDHLQIDRETTPARVISFAQTDVVDRILSGADDRFVDESEKYLASALAQAKTSVTDALIAAGMDGTLSAGIMDDVIKGVVGKYKKDFVVEARERFKSDFDEMVAMMPKQDIIELAEALVSITAIERNASSEQATVGGPVDIAFITKHEGFVWIKRKHYFDPALNPRFFWRKKMRESSEGRAG